MSEPYDVTTEKDRARGLRRLVDRTGREWTERDGDGPEPGLAAPPALTIVVVRRPSDYHASVEGHPELWGCGRSWSTAIGDLVFSHPGAFGVAIIAGRPPGGGG